MTTPPGCFFSSVNAAALVGLVPPTAGMNYAATLIRGIPRYPADPATFNPRAPIALREPSRGVGVTAAEAAWTKYRSYIDQTKLAATIRSETFARLSPTEIRKRRSYANTTDEEDEASHAFRSFFELREIGWHEYQANKYKGWRDDMIKRYMEGQKALYGVAIDNSKMLQSTDVGPALIAQAKQYQSLMTTSVDSKLIVADQYDPEMTTRGRVCEIVPARCASVVTAMKPGEGELLQWQLGDAKQQQFENVLAIGLLSTNDAVQNAPEVLPAHSKCAPFALPGTALQPGAASHFELEIANTGQRQRQLVIAYVGSFVKASWSDPDQSFATVLNPGESRRLTIDFTPHSGYEDLNAVYLMEAGRPQAELIIDYAIISDPGTRTIDIDSGNVESGNDKAWGTYEIKLQDIPPFYAVRKACVWVTGDRDNCADNVYAKCEFSTITQDAVFAKFALQGHHDTPGVRNLSVGHLRVDYQLISPRVTLK